MIALHPQFINDANGNRSLVVLSTEEFERIIEELEDAADVRLYDEAKKKEQVFADAETVFSRIEANRK